MPKIKTDSKTIRELQERISELEAEVARLQGLLTMPHSNEAVLMPYIQGNDITAYPFRITCGSTSGATFRAKYTIIY